jgi:flagellar hook-associated protein 1 FlgK
VVGADAANTGIVITDDPTSPATRAGRGFSHTFGLNDIVTKGKPINYATGLAGADNHNFSNGALTFAIRDNDGAISRTFNFNITANSSMTVLVGQLNTALSGYGSASLDATGRLSITPTNAAVGRIDVIQDTTVRGDTNLSMSDIFGLGETLPAERASNLQVRSDIRANPSLLGSAQADLWVNGAMVAANTRVLAPGDGRGALVLEAAGAAPRYFADAGGLTGQVTSVSDYAARLAGHAGVRAEALDAAKAAAESVRDEVKERRASEEGVNLDEELVKMTTYQQAYAAASRMITAARDMYDIVLNMV